MFPYYFIFSIIALCSYSDVARVNYWNRRAILAFLLCVLALFAGLRTNNPDWSSYNDGFKDLLLNTGEGFADIGFNIICRFILLLFSDTIAAFLLVAILATSLNLSSFKKYSPLFLVCVLYYFGHLYVLKEMIQIRAGLASAICVFGVRYLAEEKYMKSFLIILLAISIHLSSIVWLLVFVLQKIKPTHALLQKVVFISLLIGFFYPLGQLVKTFVGIDDRLSAYIAYGDSGYAASLGIFSNLATVKTLVILALILYFQKHFERYKYFQTLLYAYVLGTCWLLLFNDFAIIGARMSNILLSVEPILISYLLFIFSKRSRWLVLTAIVCIVFVMLRLNIAPDKVTPYQFYFFS